MKNDQNTSTPLDASDKRRRHESSVGEGSDEYTELLETIGPASELPSSSRTCSSPCEDRSLVMRDGNGRFRKGTRSPNPHGAPRKPDIGPWTERIQRKRTVIIDGRPIEMTDLEYLDRVVHRASINCDPAAMKLWEERLVFAETNRQERKARERYDLRVKRERELGIKGVSSRETLLHDIKCRDTVLKVVRVATGNFLELQQKLIDMGVVRKIDGVWQVADWLKSDTQECRN